jgi:tetratricopeptide (TPR) repeat protein
MRNALDAPNAPSAMNTNASPVTSDLKSAIKNALSLLSEGKADQARAQADEILAQYPNEINSQFVVAACLRGQGDLDGAVLCLEGLVHRAPDYALAQQELGVCHAVAGRIYPAIEALQKAVAIEPRLPTAWRVMGELFLADEDEASATESFNQYLLVSSQQPELVQAVKHFRAGRIGHAEKLCRQLLKDDPVNVSAIRLLAEIGLRVGALDDAENLLERCVELAPDFRLARLNYATVLSKREKLEEALKQVETLLESDKDTFTLLTLKGSILVKMGDFEPVLPLYEYLLKHFPKRPKVTLVYGHALKTVGEQGRAIEAYRETIALEPGFGDAWWSLANLKTFRFTDEDIETMLAEIARPECLKVDYFHLCFALGKAYELRDNFEQAYRYYELGNNTKTKLEPHNPDANHEKVVRLKSVFTPEFIYQRDGWGASAPDPIFIVGLPRSGSTLLEQILASHSQVDGTKELIYMPAIVRRLGGKIKRDKPSQFPDILADMNPEDIRALGNEYLQRSEIQRGSAPYFVDKMPNNFMHIGLIHLVMPNATIIDARRHPMAACFSGWTQLFARGQAFTYGQDIIGRYYRDYVEIMDHWDTVLPGKVLTVQYEEVVADTESQVRRILDHCGLEFEQGCLEFHRTQRAVRTASSEQVRQPIYKAAVEHWRNFESHLDELKSALGPVLERYPID